MACDFHCPGEELYPIYRNGSSFLRCASCGATFGELSVLEQSSSSSSNLPDRADLLLSRLWRGELGFDGKYRF